MENKPITDPDHLIPEHDYAGFARRAVATIVDGLILGFIGKIVASLFFSPEDLRQALFSIILGWFYYAFMESSKYQGTLGKLFIKIKVTDYNGEKITFLRATARHFLRFLSAATLFIGFLMVIWTERKQSLHDLISKTLVVKR